MPAPSTGNSSPVPLRPHQPVHTKDGAYVFLDALEVLYSLLGDLRNYSSIDSLAYLSTASSPAPPDTVPGTAC